MEFQNILLVPYKQTNTYINEIPIKKLVAGLAGKYDSCRNSIFLTATHHDLIEST